MTLQQFGQALIELLDWCFRNPQYVVAVVVIVTILGYAVQRLLTATLELITGLADSVKRGLVQRALEATRPLTAEIVNTRIRELFRPVLSLIERLMSWISSLARGARILTVGRAVPAPQPTKNQPEKRESNVSSGAATLRAQAERAIDAVGHPRGERIVGSVIFSVATLGFAYADVGLLVQTFAQADPSIKVSIDPLFGQVAYQLTASSYLSFALLGAVLFDLFGISHLGPWSESRGAAKIFLVALVLLLVILLLIQTALLSLWRADQITPFLQISSELKPALLGVSLAMTVPLMLLVSLIVFAGAPRFALVLWAVLAFIGYAVLTLFGGPARTTARGGPGAISAVGDLLSRLLRFAVLVLAIVVLALAIAAISIVVGLATALVFAVVFVALGLWNAIWTVLQFILDFLLGLVTALNQVAIRLIEVLIAPGATLWNWLARLDWAQRRLGLRPIVRQSNPEELARPPKVRVGTGVIRG